MLYLRRKLYYFMVEYAIHHNTTMYDVLTDAVLKWAKEHGFTCSHRFSTEGKEKNGRRLFKCLDCGEWVER